MPAGIDRFAKDLVAQHFGGDNACPGVPVDRVLALGAEDYEGGDPSVFNMAVMGFRLAQRANGVSELHGHVAREMFARLWPGFDEPEVPIGYITNGVHAPTWVAQEVIDLAGAGDRGQPDRRRGLGRRAARPRRPTSGRSAGCCGPGWWPTRATGCGRRGCSAAPARPSSAGSTRCSTPRC